MNLLVGILIIGLCGERQLVSWVRVNLPITLDFLFFGILTGVVFFVDDLGSFWEDPDDVGGFPPKNDRISIVVNILRRRRLIMTGNYMITMCHVISSIRISAKFCYFTRREWRPLSDVNWLFWLDFREYDVRGAATVLLFLLKRNLRKKNYHSWERSTQLMNGQTSRLQ